MVNIIKRYRNTNGGYDSIVTDGEHIVLIEDCTMTCYSKAAFAEIVKCLGIFIQGNENERRRICDL